ncbi:hypothetical protein INT43_008158 [Umbelopsis isabellina]|uniref:Peroxisomal membrane protein PEX14 n=1 Tax=Mortierella isabellina TaxID=91625 RepID=A0A8H7PD80_MORIS|nr:hypothetical protein INT43_008158 [Umbelopsis isabellina]
MSSNDDNPPTKQDQVRDLLGPPLTPEQREEKRKQLAQRQKEARAGADLSTLLAQQPPSSTETTVDPATVKPTEVTAVNSAVNSASDLPLRETLLKSAVSFLSSPNVRSADRGKKLAFLQKKGLNQREIQEAFKRVGESQPDASAIEAAKAFPQPSTPSSSLPPVPSRNNQPPQIVYVQAPPPPTVPLDKIVTMAVIIAVGAVTATTGLVALVKRLVTPTFQAYFAHRRATYVHRRELLERLSAKLKEFNRVPAPTKVTVTNEQEEEESTIAESTETESAYTKIGDIQSKTAVNLSKLSILVATVAATQKDNPLRVALTSLVSYLTQSTYSYSYSYLNSSNAGSGVSGVDAEAKEVQDIKSEIRSLKGLLLNRRNFPSAGNIQPSRSMPTVPTYHKKAAEVDDKAGK